MLGVSARYEKCPPNRCPDNTAGTVSVSRSPMQRARGQADEKSAILDVNDTANTKRTGIHRYELADANRGIINGFDRQYKSELG